jgi:predicted nucleotide-binding protein
VERGVFRPGNTFIDTLVNALPRFDFAALVLTADDRILSREVESFSQRDNVLSGINHLQRGLGILARFFHGGPRRYPGHRPFRGRE